MSCPSKSLCVLLGFLLIAPFAGADDKDKKDDKKKKDGPKPYDEVITDEAVTSKGIFLVHRIDDSVFYEIPEDALGDDFLWVTQVAATATGAGYGGSPVGNAVVRWELRDETVLLRDVEYRLRAETDDPIQAAVEASSLPSIMKSFPVKAWGKDKAPVIDVTELFTTEVSGLPTAKGIDKSRTFVETVKAFPKNVEVKVLTTHKRGDGHATSLYHHSMVQLPEDPMRPRRHDSRVGFFSVSYNDFATPKHQVDRVELITRWRLEKKDPKAELSEPKEPIVFYVGREVPEKWRPWVKKGIEAWQPAFEKAGFLKAIVAKDPPDEREDPDWDAEDARYSSIRWLPATIENAMGPHVHDPRTGEILEADILVYHNVLKLLRDWYFVQASPMDERAQKLPLPDDLMGELVAYVVAHEVGHSLGFPHNMKASSSYTIDQLRDPEYTRVNGTEASIMDYGRFNYVSQPGDGARLIPVIGPYDHFACEWGYKPFPDAKTWQDEKAELEQIVKRQLDDPRLRFGDPNPAQDPSQQTEDLGSDPIAATTLGLQNIERVAGYLVDATCEPGEDYDLLRNMYGELLGQRDRELGHVASLVGGMIGNNVWFGDGDRIFDPVPATKQREAVAFLVEHALNVPTALITPSIVDRLETHGTADRILQSQRRILSTLVNDARVKRMAEYANRTEGEVYRPADLLADLRTGIWRELGSPDPRIDLYRRNLQRAWVEMLAKEVENLDVDSDLPALARAELEKVLGTVRDATPHASDPITRAHLEDLSSRIDRALEPRSVRIPPTAAPAEATASH